MEKEPGVSSHMKKVVAAGAGGGLNGTSRGSTRFREKKLFRSYLP